MFWPRSGHLTYNSTNLPNLLIILPIFSMVFQTRLGLLHLSIRSIIRCMCTHLIDPMVSTSCIVLMAMNAWCSSQHLFCHYVKCWLPCGMRLTTCASFNHIQLLLSTIQHCAHQKWHLHFSRCCHYQPNTNKSIFQTLHKDFSSPMWLKRKKGVIMSNTPLMNSSL
jgi:hypothetical protein